MATEINEEIRKERELAHARETAIVQENSGLVTGIKVVRILGWLCALVPILGIFGIGFLAGLLPAVGFLYLLVQGAKKFAFKQLIITGAAFVCSVIVWMIVNFVVIAAFG